MQTSILIHGGKETGKTTYLHKILALLPIGSFCTGKWLNLTENTQVVFYDNVKLSFIDSILGNEFLYKHIFTTSEAADKVVTLKHRDRLLVFDLDDDGDVFKLNKALEDNFADYHVCKNCKTPHNVYHEQCVACGHLEFMPLM